MDLSMVNEVIISPPNSFGITESFVGPSMAGSVVVQTDRGRRARTQKHIRAAKRKVAEYALANGHRDPDVIAEFARSCVAAAMERRNTHRVGPNDGSAIVREALDVAMARLGVTNAMPPIAAAHKGDNRRLLRRSATPVIFVPTPQPQPMPTQPLGDLPHVLQPQWWRRVVAAIIGDTSPIGSKS